MLCDELQAYGAIGSGCDIAPIKPRIAAAQKFVLGAEFAAVADALSNDFGGLVRVFDRCRLPFAHTWIEFLQSDRPRFMQAGIHVPQLQVKPKRIGFLCTATRDDLSAWRAHLFWNVEGTAPAFACNATACAMDFDMTHDLLHLTPQELHDKHEYNRIARQIGPITIPRAKDHPGWTAADDATRIALSNRVAPRWSDFPLLAPLGVQDTRQYWDVIETMAFSDWAGEATYLLAVIGLMNARNAVEAEPVDRTRINHQRRRQGKFELFEHKVLKIASRVRARVPRGVRPHDYTPMRQHFCRGHFKARKSGVFFWHPHLRGDPARGEISKEYQLS